MNCFKIAKNNLKFKAFNFLNTFSYQSLIFKPPKPVNEPPPVVQGRPGPHPRAHDDRCHEQRRYGQLLDDRGRFAGLGACLDRGFPVQVPGDLVVDHAPVTS